MRKNARSAKSLFSEAAKVKKEIESGKLKGKKLQSAKYKYGNLMYRGRKREKSIAASFVKEQGFLPSFLKGLDIVRIEEMVADRLFNDLKGQIKIEKKIKTRKAS
jgi:hypothetical protein